METVNVCMIGHSYIRYLHNENLRFVEIKHNLRAQLSYVFRAGATFRTFLENKGWVDLAKGSNPDIIIVYLGGNDIREQTPLQVVYKNAKDFYALLRELFPNAKIVASQVESRYLAHTNSFGTPAAQQYSSLANYLNNYLNKEIKTKDKLFMVKGANKLSNPDIYGPDGVHLTDTGLMIFAHLIREFLIYYITELRS